MIVYFLLKIRLEILLELSLNGKIVFLIKVDKKRIDICFYLYVSSEGYRLSFRLRILSNVLLRVWIGPLRVRGLIVQFVIVVFNVISWL